jgi:hypothetical protein
MKRLIFTLLVSVAGFAAIVTYDAPNALFDNTASVRAEVVAGLPSN